MNTILIAYSIRGLIMNKTFLLPFLLLLANCKYSVPNAQQTASGNQTITQLPAGSMPRINTLTVKEKEESG